MKVKLLSKCPTLRDPMDCSLPGSSVHGIFQARVLEWVAGSQIKLAKFKKTEIISSIFSDHNAMRIEVNYRTKTIKNANTWRLNNMLLNHQEISEEIKEEI